MNALSSYSRRRKCRFFLDRIPADARVLEVGCGNDFMGAYLRARGIKGYVGLDLRPPADVVGDIRRWRDLAFEPASFDVVIAFEVLEHVDCIHEMIDLLKPGGLLMLTSPVPSRDWVCRLLEGVGLAQRRTSPHTHLVDFARLPLLEPVEVRRVGWLAQWGVFRKPEKAS